MELAITDGPTNSLVTDLLRNLPKEDHKCVASRIAAITDDDLTTAVRPFEFGGKVVHELHFDPSKLKLFSARQRIGAVLTALIVCCLAQETRGKPSLSNDLLSLRRTLILRKARGLNRVREVSGFIDEVKRQERELGRKNLHNYLLKSGIMVAAIRKKIRNTNLKSVDLLMTTLDVEESMARSEFELFRGEAGRQELAKYRQLLLEISSLRTDLAQKEGLDEFA